MNDDFTLLGDWHETGQRAAGVVLLDSRNRLLLQLRDTDRDTVSPGHWGIFGGRMEEGETPKETALREIAEEIGVELDRTLIKPFARAQSSHGTRLFSYTTSERISTEQITLREGAGFAFLSRTQIESLPVLPSVSVILHHFFEMHGQNG